MGLGIFMAIIISENLIAQWNGLKLYLFDTKKHYKGYCVEAEKAKMLSYVDGNKDIYELWKEVSKEYDFSQCPNAEDDIKTFYRSLMSQGILEESEQGDVNNVFGEYEKYYPLVITLELTNQCNFMCTHCYKDSNPDNLRRLPYEEVKWIIDNFSGKSYCLGLSGGEPCLHPYVNEILLYANEKNMSTRLITNLSSLSKIKDEALKSIGLLQFTLYGYNSELYYRYTRNSNFNTVKENMRRIGEQKINSMAQILLRDDVIDDLELYIALLKKYGIKRVKFGLVSKVGRGEQSYESEWKVHSGKQQIFYKKLIRIKNIYPDFIFEDFAFDNEEDGSHAGGVCFHCDAGENSIIVSENGVIRPCQYMPERIFGLSNIRQYHEVVMNGKVFDFSYCVEQYIAEQKEKGIEINEVCPKGLG